LRARARAHTLADFTKVKSIVDTLDEYPQRWNLSESEEKLDKNNVRLATRLKLNVSRFHSQIISYPPERVFLSSARLARDRYFSSQGPSSAIRHFSSSILAIARASELARAFPSFSRAREIGFFSSSTN